MSVIGGGVDSVMKLCNGRGILSWKLEVFFELVLVKLRMNGFVRVNVGSIV